MDQRFLNQRSLLDQRKLAESKIVVIGAGAIGSFFVTTITKMGAKHVVVYDNDTIEDHNIANQLYPEMYVGKPKVEALQRVAKQYSGVDIEIINAKWTPETAQDGDIIVAAVDDMDVRKAIWDHYNNRPYKLFLEGRMSAQVFRVYGITSDNEDWAKQARAYYETQLYPQAEAVPERCGEKSIIYTVLQVSGQMCSQVKRFLMNEYRPTEIQFDCLGDVIGTPMGIGKGTGPKYFMPMPATEEIDAEAELDEGVLI